MSKRSELEDFKVAFDSAPLLWKVLVIIVVIILCLLYVLIISPILLFLTVIAKGKNAPQSFNHQ